MKKKNIFRWSFYWGTFSKTTEVTLLPLCPPNWNLGVGNTHLTLNMGEKNVVNSSSVQLQLVMKKMASALVFNKSNTLCLYCVRILELSLLRLMASYVPLSRQTSKQFFMSTSRLRISQVWKNKRIDKKFKQKCFWWKLENRGGECWGLLDRTYEGWKCVCSLVLVLLPKLQTFHHHILLSGFRDALFISV